MNTAGLHFSEGHKSCAQMRVRPGVGAGRRIWESTSVGVDSQLYSWPIKAAPFIFFQCASHAQEFRRLGAKSHALNDNNYSCVHLIDFYNLTSTTYVCLCPAAENSLQRFNRLTSSMITYFPDCFSFLGVLVWGGAYTSCFSAKRASTLNRLEANCRDMKAYPMV